MFIGCPSPSRPSPSKIFHSSGASTLPKKFLFDAEFSRFKSQGFAQITSFSFISMPDYQRNDGNNHRSVKTCDNHYIFCIQHKIDSGIKSMPYNSNLEGRIVLELKGETVMENSQISGFLTVGENVNDITYWNRRWCKLDGLCLYFWNYPEENYDNILFTIDLVKCVQDKVQVVDREMCARPRTFYLDIFSSQNDKSSVKSFYLSADNQNDLVKWIRELNHKICFLRDWKI